MSDALKLCPLCAANVPDAEYSDHFKLHGYAGHAEAQAANPEHHITDAIEVSE